MCVRSYARQYKPQYGWPCSNCAHDALCGSNLQPVVRPGATYRVDLEDAGQEAILFRRTELMVEHNPADYETHQVFVTSPDGTKVPMWVRPPSQAGDEQR